MSRKQKLLRNAAIQKEQQQILAVQKELEEMITKVNEAINFLKVEELQLKSCAVSYENPYSSNTDDVKPSTSTTSYLTQPPSTSRCILQNATTTFSDWTLQNNLPGSLVNRQEVDLDIRSFIKPNQDIEEDDE